MNTIIGVKLGPAFSFIGLGPAPNKVQGGHCQSVCDLAGSFLMAKLVPLWFSANICAHGVLLPLDLGHGCSLCQYLCAYAQEGV